MMTVQESEELDSEMNQEEYREKADSFGADEMENADEEKPSSIMIPDVDIPVNVSSLPSLKGQYRQEEGDHYFSGYWALNDYSHTLDGQTSEFEYKLIEKFPNSGEYPPSGKYLGWFYLKHPAPKPGHLKIDDKDVFLNFFPDGDSDGYKVSGEGYNKFGKFSVHGKLSSEGKLHVYKIFKKKPLNTPKVGRSASVPKHAQADSLTPREGRVRKPSAILSAGMHEVMEIVPLSRQNSKQVVSAPPASHPSAAPSSKESGRAARLSVPLQKCADLLKELQKQQSSLYFKEPVDYVKLCIPDYITIIKEPMDFQTIQTNMEKSLYQSHEAFAEHVRLVFKNAITYNQRRDHPVHIAAREMSNRFEEKYRQLISQLNVASDFETNFRPGSLTLTASGSGGKGGKAGRRQSSGGSSGRVSVGPRDMVVMPPALDVSMQSLVEMQKQMRDMQEELALIKSQLRQYDIKMSLEVKRQAAQDPMTFEEKQALVERINRLDGDRIKEIIDVIKEVLPSAMSADGEDVDIPIDDLDTLTLRRLQSIVQKGEKETLKRRRSSQPNTPKAPGAKRSKSSAGMATTPKAVPAAPVLQPLHQESSYNTTFFGATDDLDLLGEGDEPVSMDTAMPARPASHETSWRDSAVDYNELMMEVAVEQGLAAASTGGEGGAPMTNASAWISSTENVKVENEVNATGTTWSTDVIQEKIDGQRTEQYNLLERGGNVDIAEPREEVSAESENGAAGPDPSSILQKREEERQRRLDMERTVNLDQHREALYGAEDII